MFGQLAVGVGCRSWLQPPARAAPGAVGAPSPRARALCAQATPTRHRGRPQTMDTTGTNTDWTYVRYEHSEHVTWYRYESMATEAYLFIAAGVGQNSLICKALVVRIVDSCQRDTRI